jgi:drug/metabolite transporter (DMT)-like permease
MPLPDHLKGVAIAGAGVTVLSLDAPLVRLIDADAFTTALWRGVLMAFGFGALAALHRRGQLLADLRAFGRYDLLAALAFASGNLCFVIGAKLIPVANLLLFVACSPLATAAMARLLLGERLRPSTLVAILGAFAGIAVLVAGELRAEADLIGHLVGLGVPLSTGVFFTLLRRARSSNSGPILVAAGGIVAAAMLPFAWAPVMPAASVPYMVLLGLVVIPVAFTLISQGPRYLPAAEASLLMLLETVFGPVWAWLLLSELPSPAAFAGGALVLGSVAGHVLVSTRSRPAPG